MKYNDLMHRDGFCDLHVHTNRSDAMSRWSPEEVILRAKDLGITHLALSDHNMVNPAYLEQSLHYDIDVISSGEFSANEEINGQMYEIHVVGYRIDPEDAQILKLVEQSRQNRDLYLNAMLTGLQQEGIQITLEELKEHNPESFHIGRVAIGEILIERGHAKTMREVYDRYLGKESGSPAYAPSGQFLKYPSLRQVVLTIIGAGGLPILAHVPYYGMNDLQEYKLLHHFQWYARRWACMETEHGDYPPEIVEQQKHLVRIMDFVESTGSDFHGYEGLDLKQGSPEIFQKIQKHWEEVHI